MTDISLTKRFFLIKYKISLSFNQHVILSLNPLNIQFSLLYYIIIYA